MDQLSVDAFEVVDGMVVPCQGGSLEKQILPLAFERMYILKPRADPFLNLRAKVDR